MFIIPGNTLWIASKRKLYLKTFQNLTPKTLSSVLNYDKTAATQGKIL